MKFKLDENLGASVREVLEDGGHDVRTVREEHLLGASDPEVFAAARREARILVTLDHGFGSVLAYRHEDAAGVAVMNLPGRPSLPLLRVLARTLLEALRENAIGGRLWIVEPGRVREHQRPGGAGLEESG